MSKSTSNAPTEELAFLRRKAAQLEAAGDPAGLLSATRARIAALDPSPRARRDASKKPAKGKPAAPSKRRSKKS